MSRDRVMMMPHACSVERQPGLATLIWYATIDSRLNAASIRRFVHVIIAGETHLNMQQYIRATQLPITTKFSLPPFTKPDVRLPGADPLLLH